MDLDYGTCREQIAAALGRAVYATKRSRDDIVPCQIEDGLFLGSLGAANNKSALKSLNVTHILTVIKSVPLSHSNDFIYKTIDVEDRKDVNIAQYFDECFDFIDEAKTTGGGVLVHCFMGKSRSVTIVVAYLMKKHGMSVSQALEHVKSRRLLASPNSGFMLQLQKFEKSIQDMVGFKGFGGDFGEGGSRAAGGGGGFGGGMGFSVGGFGSGKGRWCSGRVVGAARSGGWVGGGGYSLYHLHLP